MSDLISREMAIDEMLTRKRSAYEWYKSAKVKDDDEIMVRADSAVACFIECILTLKQISSIDAVEVVRCKDCKWYGEPGCAIQIIDDSDRPKETDFCSFAERRIDG